MNSEQVNPDRKGLEGLQARQKAMDFAKRIYKEILPLLPKEEKWAMAAQIRRAASSIPANIAEGYGRFYYQEGVRFCYVARGSLDEVTTFIILAKDLNYISGDLSTSLRNDATELRRVISGYVSYLKKSKPGQSEPGAGLALRENSAVYSDVENELETDA